MQDSLFGKKSTAQSVKCHAIMTVRFFLGTGRRHNESCPISNVNQLDMTTNSMSQLVNIFKCAVQHTGPWSKVRLAERKYHENISVICCDVYCAFG